MMRIMGFSLVSVLCLTGCLDDRVKSVEAEMEEVKSKPPIPIAAAPVFQPVKSFTYDANKMRSPFMPPTLSTRLAAEQQMGQKVKPDPDRPPEELEYFEITELAMKGTIQDTNGKIFALIEDPKGKVVKAAIGAYVGKNDGRIVDINAKQVELIEIVSDGSQGYVERPKTLMAVAES